MPEPSINSPAYHALSATQVLDQLKSDPKSGLSQSEVEARWQQFGKNVLPDSEKETGWSILFRQFQNWMFWILVAAAVLSALFQEWLDSIVIVIVLSVNVLIGFFEEYRAERALRALRDMLQPKAKVLRSGNVLMVLASDLVPGDIILIQEGDKVPADARLLQIDGLQVSEAVLTGESFPVDKSLQEVQENAPLADRLSLIFMGTLVVRGSGSAVVVQTGSQTIFGTIATQLATLSSRESHFEKQMKRLSAQMAALGISLTALTFIAGYFWRHFPLHEILSFAIAALVSVIPEDLPVIVAIVLAVGARRMAKKKAIVRQLAAVETLGAVSTIVSDKTGTITLNMMRANSLVLPDGSAFSLTEKSDEEKILAQLPKNTYLQRILASARVNHSLQLSRQSDGRTEYLGDPTERAIVEYAEKMPSQAFPVWQKVFDLGFIQERRWRASLVVSDSGERFLVAFGAPEMILEVSALSQASEKEKIEHQTRALTSQAMRVVALAIKKVDAQVKTLTEKDVAGLEFLGLIGINDPPRPEIIEALKKSREAGIRVIMATGDHPHTATAIARQIGLLDASFPQQAVVTGAELENASDEAFAKAVQSVSVCARFTPTLKLRLAQVLQAQGQVVAMTGDGVNDAPALKQADVGIAMAISGTEVARESSDIVLADDNFASIIDAIEEGRTQFRNVRRASLFLITTNLAESATLFATLFLGWPLPLLPVQILWLNIVTDGIIDLPLSFEPSHEDVLKVPPVDPQETLLHRRLIPFLFITIGVMAVLTLSTFWIFLPVGLDKARTGAFVALSLTQLFNLFNMRSLKHSLFSLGLWSNPSSVVAFVLSFFLLIFVIYTPFLGNLFSFVPLSLVEFLIILACSTLVFWGVELYKLLLEPTET